VGKRTIGSGILNDDRPENTSGGADTGFSANDGPDLRKLLDSLTSLVAYVGTDKKFRYANPAYCERYGISSTDIIGRNVREVIGPSAFEAIEPDIDRALAGEPVSYERLVTYGDGSECYVRVSYTPEVDARGTVTGYFAMIVDVTDQFKTEKALKESDDRYRAFIAQSSEGIWRFELDEPISINLPIDQQIALELTYWEDLPAPEIAHVLNVPLNTVYSRLRRAREHLRAALGRFSTDGAEIEGALRELAVAED